MLRRQNQALQVENNANLRESLVARLDAANRQIANQLGDARTQTMQALGELRAQTDTTLANHQTQFEKRQGDALRALQESLNPESAEATNGVEIRVGGPSSRRLTGSRLRSASRMSRDRKNPVSPPASGEVEPESSTR